MPALCARPIRLTAAQRHQLQKIARGHKSPHRDKVRAQIVLDAYDDYPNAAIARRQRVSVDTVRKWRGRYAAEGMHGLRDRKRSGRPPRFTAMQHSQVKALACELPATSGVPLSRWSSAELAHEAVTAGMVASISGSTVVDDAGYRVQRPARPDAAWLTAHRWTWDPGRLDTIITQARHASVGTLWLCGRADNAASLTDRFDAVFLLDAHQRTVRHPVKIDKPTRRRMSIDISRGIR